MHLTGKRENQFSIGCKSEKKSPLRAPQWLEIGRNFTGQCKSQKTAKLAKRNVVETAHRFSTIVAGVVLA
jgi:hypothetical protein